MADQPDVVSVKLAKPAPEAPKDEGTPQQPPTHMMSSAWPQQPCILSGLSSAVGAGVLGFVFGAFPSMIRNRRLSAWQLWAMDGWRSTLGLGLVSGMYTWVHCLATRIRLKDDGWNRGLAGCATGLVLGWQGGPMSAAQSCAGLGLVSYIVDFAGAAETPAAHAAELDSSHWGVYGSPETQAQPWAAGHACVGACCNHPELQHHVSTRTATGRASCSGCTPTGLSLALAAIAQAAFTVAGASPPNTRDRRTAGPVAVSQGSSKQPDSLEDRSCLEAAMALQRASAAGRQGHGKAPGNAGTAAGAATDSSSAQAATTATESDIPLNFNAPNNERAAIRLATTGALASATCSGHAGTVGGRVAGTGTGARVAHGPDHLATEAAARGMALLAWPGPACAEQLPPVMWLGHVLARPYFN